MKNRLLRACQTAKQLCCLGNSRQHAKPEACVPQHRQKGTRTPTSQQLLHMVTLMPQMQQQTSSLLGGSSKLPSSAAWAALMSR